MSESTKEPEWTLVAEKPNPGVGKPTLACITYQTKEKEFCTLQTLLVRWDGIAWQSFSVTAIEERNIIAWIPIEMPEPYIAEQEIPLEERTCRDCPYVAFWPNPHGTSCCPVCELHKLTDPKPHLLKDGTLCSDTENPNG